MQISLEATGKTRDFKWYLHPRLRKKLDLMIARLEKKDAWILIDGDEGSGKSTMASFVMEYISCQTGRTFTEDNFYFDAEQLLSAGLSSANKLLNWDEAALGGLSTQWWNKQQQDLKQFGMTGRMMHHFVTMCVPKFHELGKYFCRDRCVGPG